VVRYSVFRDGDSIGITSELYYEDCSLQPGTPYVYCIQANDASGNRSECSREIQVSTRVVGEETLATHSFSNRAGFGTHPLTLTLGGGIIRVDLRSIAGDRVYRAVFNPRRSHLASAAYPGNAFSFSDLIIHDATGKQLAVSAPRFLTLEATQAVQAALDSGLTELELTVVHDPGGSLFYSNPVLTLEVMCNVPLPDPIVQVTGVGARFKDGDTMISFEEVDPPLTDENTSCDQFNTAWNNLDREGEIRYRIYRSNHPVQSPGDGTGLQYVDEIKPLSCWDYSFFGLGNCTGSSQVPCYPLDDLQPAPPGTGIYVRRFDGDYPETVYYYVSRAVNGAEDFSRIAVNGNATNAVVESPGNGMVVLREQSFPESFYYVDDPVMNYYVRWECPPAAHLPSTPFDYLVAESPLSRLQEHPAVNLALHCWGGSLRSGYGWWYRAEEGSILVSTNQFPYDWWTAYHENNGTIRSLTGGVVRPFNQYRILSFLYDFVLPCYRADSNRITLSGVSMGGSGASMWGIRSGHLFSNVISWVGVHIPEQTPTFYNSFISAYGGERDKNCVYDNTSLLRFGYEKISADEGISPWDYWDNNQWLRTHERIDLPWISYANGRNDDAIGWEQAYTMTGAMKDTRRPFNFNWDMSGHGSRASLPGTGNDRYCRVDFSREQLLPAFSRCSFDNGLGASAAESPESGQINRYFQWDTESMIDSLLLIAMNVWLIESAPSDTCTSDITFRRIRHLWVEPGFRYDWELVDLSSGLTIRQGTVTADANSLITLENVAITKGAHSRRILVRLDLNSIPDVSPHEIITNSVFPYGTEQCFGAYDSITLAGNGNTVQVESGSRLSLIAGKTIRFLPGFLTEEGSVLSARITPDSTFCYGRDPSEYNEEIAEKSRTYILERNLKDSVEKSFKIYPNPTRGLLVIEQENFTNDIDVRIMNVSGSILHSQRLQNGNRCVIDLEGKARGICIIALKDDETALYRKFVIQ